MVELIIHAPEGTNETFVNVWNTIIFLAVMAGIGRFVYKLVKKDNK